MKYKNIKKSKKKNKYLYRMCAKTPIFFSNFQYATIDIYVLINIPKYLYNIIILLDSILLITFIFISLYIYINNILFK